MTNDMTTTNAITTAEFTHSGAPYTNVDSANKAIVDCLKTGKGLSISVESGITTGVANANFGLHPYPVVCIINGAGGNGKDTFVNAVGKHCSAQNLSSVDIPKDVVNTLLMISSEFDANAMVEKENKTTKYRQLIHAVKMAWADFNDGPNKYLIYNLTNLLTEQINNQGLYDVVFFHVREKDEIEKLKSDIMSKVGIPVITVLINGLVDPATYSGGCEADAQVLNYQYDLTIANTPGNMAVFEMQAMMFANLIKIANSTYGIYHATLTGTQMPTTDVISTATGIGSQIYNGDTTGTNTVVAAPSVTPIQTQQPASQTVVQPEVVTPQVVNPIQVVNPAESDNESEVTVQTLNPISTFH